MSKNEKNEIKTENNYNNLENNANIANYDSKSHITEDGNKN